MNYRDMSKVREPSNVSMSMDGVCHFGTVNENSTYQTYAILYATGNEALQSKKAAKHLESANILYVDGNVGAMRRADLLKNMFSYSEPLFDSGQKH